MASQIRYRVHWTDADGTTRDRVFAGRGCFVSALSLRDRLSEDSAAFVSREELRPVPTWVSTGIVEGLHPGRQPRRTLTTRTEDRS